MADMTEGYPFVFTIKETFIAHIIREARKILQSSDSDDFLQS